MKQLPLVLSLLVTLAPLLPISGQGTPQEKITSRLDSVKVFLSGAQLSRSATLSVPAGKSSIVLSDLSPFIEPQSIQASTASDVLILSVNHQLDYLGEAAADRFTLQIEAVQDSIALAQAMLEVANEEMAFLKNNNTISGTQTGLELANLRTIGAYYRKQMTDIRLERQFIGSKQLERRAWRMQAKNNKAQEIDLVVLDQVPVSQREDIEVQAVEAGNGTVNSETGTIRW